MRPLLKGPLLAGSGPSQVLGSCSEPGRVPGSSVVLVHSAPGAGVQWRAGRAGSPS